MALAWLSSSAIELEGSGGGPDRSRATGAGMATTTGVVATSGAAGAAARGATGASLSRCTSKPLEVSMTTPDTPLCKSFARSSGSVSTNRVFQKGWLIQGPSSAWMCMPRRTWVTGMVLLLMVVDSRHQVVGVSSPPTPSPEYRPCAQGLEGEGRPEPGLNAAWAAARCADRRAGRTGSRRWPGPARHPAWPPCPP